MIRASPLEASFTRANTLPDFNDAIYSIYEATLSPEHWSAAMDAIAALSGSEGAFLCARSTSGRWLVDTASPKLDDSIRISQEEKWWQQNPWLDQSIEAGYRVGDAYCDQDVLRDKQMEELPYYTQFLPRVGLGWQMACAIQSDIGALTALVVQRAKAKGPFQPPELDTLRQVSRHVEQSLRISSHFSIASPAAAAFDSLDRAAFVVDQEQKPLLVNRPGRGLLGQYFTHEDGRLTPTQKQEHLAFQNAVRNAHDGEAPNGGAPQPTTISGPDGASRLVVWTLPVLGASASHLGLNHTSGTPDDVTAKEKAARHTRPRKAARHVLILAQPLETDRVIDPTVLRDAFQLTLGEARLAALLGAGDTLKASAEALGITEGTARVVLKRVFQKLGVSRQAELVAKLTLFAHNAS